MEDDSRILREFQRLSVGGFDALQNSIQQYNNDIVIDLRKKKKKKKKPNHTFNSIAIHQNENSNKYNILNGNGNDNNDHKYIHNNQQYKQYTHNEHKHTNGPSVDEIINDLKRRRQYRLSHNKSATSINKTYSRFMLANATNNDKHINIYNKDNEIHSLQTQLREKDDIIHALRLELDELNDSHDTNSGHGSAPTLNRHRRQKSVTQTQTEESTIENVRWSLRSEISKMTGAENDINRLLQSIGDTSMIHARLKKIYYTISAHKRKVAALEQSLNVDEFGGFGDAHFDEDKLQNMFGGGEEKKDFEILSKEYSKLKLQIAELKQEQNEWNNSKKELKSMDKRCATLMNMLDKLSDEKLQLTLQIEDLHAFINKHNLMENR